MKKSAKNRGFTLVELMVGLVLTLIVSVGIYQVLIKQSQISAKTATQSELLRRAGQMERIIEKEFFQAGYGGVLAFDYLTSNQTQIMLYADLDLNDGGLVNLPGKEPEIILYRYDPGKKTLFRNIPTREDPLDSIEMGPDEAIFENLHEFSIRYIYDVRNQCAKVPCPSECAGDCPLPDASLSDFILTNGPQGYDVHDPVFVDLGLGETEITAIELNLGFSPRMNPTNDDLVRKTIQFRFKNRLLYANAN